MEIIKSRYGVFTKHPSGSEYKVEILSEHVLRSRNYNRLFTTLRISEIVKCGNVSPHKVGNIISIAGPLICDITEN